MWLVDRESDGLNTRRIRLPEIVREALVRWYVGEGSRHDEEAGIALVQQARLGRRWIACDCLEETEQPPILTPAFLSEAETYYLRRLTGARRPDHRSDCPFFREQATNRITETRNPQTPADPPTGYFEVIRPAPEKLAQMPETGSSDDRTRQASVPRLARLLWRLVALSAVNRTLPLSLDHDPRSIGDEFKAIAAAAGKIEIAPGIELGRALWTHVQALHSNRAYAVLRELARQWPNGYAPQAFLCLFANGFKGGIVEPAGGEALTVANRVQSPSVRGNLIRGPYLILIVLGEYPEARGYAPLRAYAQPIFSGQRFVPIESDFDREVFRGLLGVRKALDRQGIDVVIDKPVFDQLTDAGPCKPDFVIEAHSRRTGEVKQIIIEAMGLASTELLAAKRATHQRMNLIAPVTLVEPDDLEENRFRLIVSEALNL